MSNELILYWPVAETIETNEIFGNRLHTYDCCNSIDDCVKVFDNWSKSYHITKAWVQRFMNGMYIDDMYFRKNEDGFWEGYDIIWSLDYESQKIQASM